MSRQPVPDLVLLREMAGRTSQPTQSDGKQAKSSSVDRQASTSTAVSDVTHDVTHDVTTCGSSSLYPNIPCSGVRRKSQKKIPELEEEEDAPSFSNDSLEDKSCAVVSLPPGEANAPTVVSLDHFQQPPDTHHGRTNWPAKTRPRFLEETPEQAELRKMEMVTKNFPFFPSKDKISEDKKNKRGYSLKTKAKAAEALTSMVPEEYQTESFSVLIIEDDDLDRSVSGKFDVQVDFRGLCCSLTDVPAEEEAEKSSFWKKLKTYFSCACKQEK